MNTDILTPTPLARLNLDVIRAMAADITDNEARYLVDLYYQMQKARIQMNNRVKGLVRDAKKEHKKEESHLSLDFYLDQFKLFEDNLKRSLSIYADHHEMAWFFEQTLGVGPVIAAGLAAHIDIERAQTAGAIWRFAGLEPTVKWEKKTKRPWNAQLKTLCWKLGDSFVKLSGREDAFYAQLYKQRKVQEEEKNEQGLFAEQAQQKLEAVKIGKDTDAYKAYSIGKLPPAHLDQRARRYAVKMFLSHLHQRWREERGLPLARPWVLEHGGHAHFIEPPQKKIGL